MNPRAFALCGSAALAGIASADFVGIAVDEFVGEGWVENGYGATGLTTYRMYANFTGDEGDGVVAVFGLEGLPMSLNSSAGYHNDPLGGLTAPLDLTGAGIWSNQWDTYVTIGKTDSEDDATTTSPGFGSITNNLSSDWTIINGGWFVTPEDPQAEADATNQVLLAQLVAPAGDGEPVFSGTLNLLLLDATNREGIAFATSEARTALVVRIETMQSDTTQELPLSEVTIPRGRPFAVELWATDVGAALTGLVGVYVDLLFSPQAVQAISIDHRPPFNLLEEGDIDNVTGVISGLGGSDQNFDCIGIDPEWVRVAVVEFEALCDITSGDFILSDSPNEVSACGIGAIPPSSVGFDSASTEIVEPCPYDLDESGFIAAGDLGVFAACWLQSEGDPDYDLACDFDCNGTVAAGDLGWFAAGWLQDCGEIVDDDLPPCRCGTPLPMATSEMTDTTSPSSAATDVALHLVPLSLPSAVDITEELPAPLAEAEVDESFVLELWVSDVGSQNTGIIGAYFDLAFDPAVLRADGLVHSGLFNFLREGVVDNDNGLITNFGGADGTFDGLGVEPEWARLGYIEMTPLAVSEMTSITSAIGIGGIGVRGRSAPPLEDIEFGMAALAVVESCPADLNGSGAVDFGDIVAILSVWGNIGGPEDLDMSGTVDFGDLLVVLSSWGPCPVLARWERSSTAPDR